MEQLVKAREEKYVDLGRAAALLGISESVLYEISCETGLGHKETRGSKAQTYFTYEELRQICMLSVHRVH